jgi:ABC-type multidrug transport system ATPase subunit
LEVEEGEILGLLGPNGAGKTTTILMLATVIKPTEGTAYVSGVSSFRTAPMMGDNVAMVSNVGSPAISVADAVVRNGLKLAKLSEKTKVEIEKAYPGVDPVNPIDLMADARAERFQKVLDLVLADEKIDGFL